MIIIAKHQLKIIIPLVSFITVSNSENSSSVFVKNFVSLLQSGMIMIQINNTGT